MVRKSKGREDAKLRGDPRNMFQHSTLTLKCSHLKVTLEITWVALVTSRDGADTYIMKGQYETQQRPGA